MNNNAAAPCSCARRPGRMDREVIVSRGTPGEIGDASAVPDVLARSGGGLVEVGDDEPRPAPAGLRAERATSGFAALLLRAPVELPPRSASPSCRAALDGSAAVARRRPRGRAAAGFAGLGPRTSSPASRRRARWKRGRRRASFSSQGDKLLGGPQAPESIVGTQNSIEKLRRHPLPRRLRIDKLSLAALEGTLRVYLTAPEPIPVLRMLHEGHRHVRARRPNTSGPGSSAAPSRRRVGVGGGALPLAELSSFACAIEGRSRHPCPQASRRSSASSATASSCSTTGTLADEARWTTSPPP